MSRKFLLILLSMILFPVVGGAKSLQLSLAEVEQALNEADGRLQGLLDRELQSVFERLNLSLEEGKPVFHFSEGDIVLQGGCDSRSRLEQIDGTVTLRDTSRAALRVIAFSKPVSLQLSLDADLIASGRMAQEWGIGSERHCNRYADYTFDFDATGNLVVMLDVTFLPQIEYLEEGIKYTPIPTVQARIEHASYTIDVKDKNFASLIRKKIDGYIQPYLDPATAAAFSLQLEQRLKRSIVDAWGAEYLIVRLPELDQRQLEETLSRLQQRFADEAFDPEDHLGELYYLLLSGDDELWDSLLDDATICELGGRLMAEMPTEPLYRQEGVACLAVDPRDIPAGAYFADAACRQMIQYEPQSLKAYCAELSGTEKVELTAEPSPWYLSPVTRLDIGVEGIRENHQPFTTRVVYKRAGTCELEMRVYRRSLSGGNLEPLMMIHGGSWERRRNGLLGMESQISHYTEQGFVVFVPSYRLTGDIEGETDCNGVDGEAIVEDVADALAWVQSHGVRYGAKAGPVALFGQSAGGLLALRLATEQPEQVRRLMLLYPATDLGDFLTRWRAGELGDEPDGLEALEGFVGRPVASLQPDDPAILRNSIPGIIASMPQRFPPMFVIHGSGDSLVPVSQSVRLCNALSGNPEQGPVTEIPSRVADGRGRSYDCDQRGSRLQVVTAAEHMLDGCLFSLLCPAGGPESQLVAQAFLRTGRQWLIERDVPLVLPPGLPGYRR